MKIVWFNVDIMSSISYTLIILHH